MWDLGALLTPRGPLTHTHCKIIWKPLGPANGLTTAPPGASSIWRAPRIFHGRLPHRPKWLGSNPVRAEADPDFVPVGDREETGRVGSPGRAVLLRTQVQVGMCM